MYKDSRVQRDFDVKTSMEGVSAFETWKLYIYGCYWAQKWHFMEAFSQGGSLDQNSCRTCQLECLFEELSPIGSFTSTFQRHDTRKSVLFSTCKPCVSSMITVLRETARRVLKTTRRQEYNSTIGTIRNF